MLVGFDEKGQQELNELFHWRKRCYGIWSHILARNDSFILKHLTEGFINYKHAAFQFTGCLLMDWSHVNNLIIYVLKGFFKLSFWRHPFTAEDPLGSKWCNAKFLKICSDKEKTNPHLGWS